MVLTILYSHLQYYKFRLFALLLELNTNDTLNNMASKYAENKTVPFRIESFSYNNSVVMETMFKYLEKTNFMGVSVSLFCMCLFS